MGMIEYRSIAGGIIELPIELDFPKCVCGGEFKVVDVYTIKNKHWGTAADCKECGEHFFGYNYGNLKNDIPYGQEMRKE